MHHPVGVSTYHARLVLVHNTACGAVNNYNTIKEGHTWINPWAFIHESTYVVQTTAGGGPTTAQDVGLGQQFSFYQNSFAVYDTLV